MKSTTSLRKPKYFSSTTHKPKQKIVSKLQIDTTENIPTDREYSPSAAKTVPHSKTFQAGNFKKSVNSPIASNVYTKARFSQKTLKPTASTPQMRQNKIKGNIFVKAASLKPKKLIRSKSKEEGKLAVQTPQRTPQHSILKKPDSKRGVMTTPKASKIYTPQAVKRSTLRKKTAEQKAQQQSDPSSKAPLSEFVTKVKATEVANKDQQLTPAEIRARSELIYKEHLFQTFQAMKFVRMLPQIDYSKLKPKMVKLPKRSGYEDMRTLVFDLDETLVHCWEDVETSNPDLIVPVTFPTGETVNAGINVRPFAVECLVEANKYFEVVIFTASHPCYANVVLDKLDPSGQLIHHRLFRDNCINVEGVNIKDLRVFADRNLQDIVIVDNAAYSFAYQIDNGIPIISWHDDPHDRELFNLMDYMKQLVNADDMWALNRDTFHLRTFYEDYINEFLRTENQSKNSRPKRSKRK